MDLKNMSFTQKTKWAKDDEAPIDVLRELASDEDSEIRRMVSNNHNTPGDILRKLVKEKDAWIIRHAVCNPNLPDDLLRELVRCDDWVVKINVINNPRTSSNLLVIMFEYEKTLKSPDIDVLDALYHQPELPLFAKRVIETLFGYIFEELL